MADGRGHRHAMTMADEVLHVARVDEIDALTLHAIMRLRCDVFVVEQQCAYHELDGVDAEPTTRHLWLTSSDGPPIVAYLRVMQSADGSTRIGRIVTCRSHRERGIGTRLVETALSMIDDEVVPVCGLNAQVSAARWYGRFGFEECGPVFAEDGISHVPMRRIRPAPTVVASAAVTP